MIMVLQLTSGIRYLSLLLLLIGVTISCRSASDESESEVFTPDMHNSMISLDWAGSYHGLLPCADCEAIDTRISLTEDLTYRKEKIYIGKSDQVFRNEGTFTWSEDGSRIQLNNLNPSNTPGVYQVGENRLFLLDMGGNRIEGELADHYILTKVIDNLSGLQWELLELDSREINLNRESLVIPTLHFSIDDNRITGTGSCNRFNGKYEIKSDNRISFTNIASTRIGCADMEIEYKFFEILERTSQYSLNHDTLSLNPSDQAYLARFILQNE